MATLRNRQSFSTTVHAHDGDSVMLPPRSVHEVDDKFLWNLPQGVMEVKAASILAQIAPQANIPATTPASEAGAGSLRSGVNAPANVTVGISSGSPVP